MPVSAATHKAAHRRAKLALALKVAVRLQFPALVLRAEVEEVLRYLAHGRCHVGIPIVSEELRRAKTTPAKIEVLKLLALGTTKLVKTHVVTVLMIIETSDRKIVLAFTFEVPERFRTLTPGYGERFRALTPRRAGVLGAEVRVATAEATVHEGFHVQLQATHARTGGPEEVHLEYAVSARIHPRARAGLPGENSLHHVSGKLDVRLAQPVCMAKFIVH